MPKVTGLLESSLYVQDLERAAQFYQNLFGFERLFADERLCALNVADKQVLLLFKKGASSDFNPMPGGFIPPHDAEGRIHFAFSVPASDLAAWEQMLADSGIPIESKLKFSRGGCSLYFRDPDDNLVELVTPGLWSIY